MHYRHVSQQVSIFVHVCRLSHRSKKNTGFLRFRLPVLLQQNLRCKGLGWHCKDQILHFAISEQCSHKGLDLNQQQPVTAVLITTIAWRSQNQTLSYLSTSSTGSARCVCGGGGEIRNSRNLYMLDFMSTLLNKMAFENKSNHTAF